MGEGVVGGTVMAGVVVGATVGDAAMSVGDNITPIVGVAVRVGEASGVASPSTLSPLFIIENDLFCVNVFPTAFFPVNAIE